jgi:hypothetical protein
MQHVLDTISDLSNTSSRIPTPKAAGGIATQRTTVTVGEAGDEAILPLSQLKNMNIGNSNNPVAANLHIGTAVFQMGPESFFMIKDMVKDMYAEFRFEELKYGTLM